jgi:RimJ/RimL family protein N-acetyltransferase
MATTADVDPLPTVRLSLVRISSDDAADLYDVLADPALGWWTAEAVPADVAEVRRRIRGWTEQEPADQRWHNWLVRRRDDDRPVGYVQATVMGPRVRLAWVVRVDAQRRRYATEAARAVMEALRGDGVQMFEATIAAGHDASEGVAWNLGMEATDEVEDGERVWRLET